MSESSEDLSREPLLAPSDGTAHTNLHGGTLTAHAKAEGYTYAYGPGGFAGLLHNRVALACAVFASIGGLTFGACVLYIVGGEKQPMTRASRV
jgi:hypothetical protein